MIRGQHTIFQKVRFYNSVAALNAAALFLFINLFHPFGFLEQPKENNRVYAAPVVMTPQLPPTFAISGRPTHIEIVQPTNGMHIDLPVRDGHYDPVQATWTLNQHDAFYATPSVVANDTQGTTMIYGHNEANVFSHLSSLKHGTGAYALVHTDTGATFRYSYQNAADTKPDDVSVFRNDGPPTLVVQTCSGSWFELRRMYNFSFESIES